MFDYNAPQFINFEEPDNCEFGDSSFFELQHLSQERETKRTPRSRLTVAQSMSGKKHSMITRMDSVNNDVLHLRQRSVGKCHTFVSGILSKERESASGLKKYIVNSLTVPVTPVLLTKTRNRQTAALPHEDKTLLEVEKYNTNKCFPLPLNKTLLGNPPSFCAPHVQTVPKPFNTTQSDLMGKALTKPEIFVFKAQPVPKSTYKRPFNKSKPFTVKERYILQKRKKKDRDVENQFPLSGKRCKVIEESSFQLVKKLPTEAKDMIFQTAMRAAFNAGYSEKLRQRQLYYQQIQEKQEKELGVYRKSLVHKPLPVPQVIRQTGCKRKPYL